MPKHTDPAFLNGKGSAADAKSRKTSGRGCFELGMRVVVLIVIGGSGSIVVILFVLYVM